MSDRTSPIATPLVASAGESSVQHCPVCCQPESRFLCKMDEYLIVSCPECGCDYVQNPPGEKELKIYYGRREWFEGGEQGGYQNYDAQTEESLQSLRIVLEGCGEERGSLLDVGCGYGSHLQIAAEMGWRCFGVELSDHARAVAVERLGDRATIVPSTDDLIPHPFDVILLLDVIEHVSDPYSLLYPLFALGAIQPHTRVIVTTPNAGCTEAAADPAAWAYRHPPSHLTYFTQQSLNTLFRALRFTQVDIEGIYPLLQGSSTPLSIEHFAGLLLEASGSDFQAFMQERYVPSTWSEIAEYEHFPRYELARRFASGLKVLDFGCGTGYGTAMLAAKADSALGVDIDASALEWARRSHRLSNLVFERNGDFLAGFEPHQFDLITCFEMIEHVSEPDQVRAVHALAGLLRPQGLLLISTPNPEITNLYGANPYHLRERTREEFLELLRGEFASVQIVDQYALVGIFFSAGQQPYPLQGFHGGPLASATPLAYVAVCSHGPLPVLNNIGYVDTKRDYIAGRLGQEKKMVQARLDAYQFRLEANQARLDAYQFRLEANQARLDVRQYEDEVQSLRLQSQVAEQAHRSTVVALEGQLESRLHQISELSSHAAELERQLDLERRSRWARLGQRLRTMGVHRSLPFRGGASLLGALRRQVRRPLAPVGTNVTGPIPLHLEPSDQAYTVRQPPSISSARPTVLHALANFCLGGSSRLVVDLLESLGNSFDQLVVTRYVPTPPAYLNLTIYEYAQPSNSTPFEALIDHLQPAFVHVHYWGDCDQDWYAHVFHACEKKGVPVIQNINTPIAPYLSSCISRNVYVSDFVRQIYGINDAKALVIHPGSDLEHFSKVDLSSIEDNCIGMVYRLENDKLNSSSIDVFIKVAQRRPATRCLIVGDGSLKPAFEQKVALASVQDNFVFTGYVPYKDLPDFYAQMSIFVAPVWKESFGQVSSFAMNMGLPVVGYAVGAIPSIVDDSRLLATHGDSDGLADLIVALLNDRERRMQIGMRNHEKAQAEYSVVSMVNKYRDLYVSMA